VVAFKNLAQAIQWQSVCILCGNDVGHRIRRSHGFGLSALAAKNCDQAQGFFIAKSMPADELEKWLEEYDNGQFRLAMAS